MTIPERRNNSVARPRQPAPGWKAPSATLYKIGQNLKYDQHVFANHGITLRGVAHDTLLQSYVLESGKDAVRGHDLGRQLALRHLGLETVSYEQLCGKG